MKIFFVTDIHGSSVCFRKFLNALRIYKVDAGILMGDLTGKMLIPLVARAGGGWTTTFMGRTMNVGAGEELDQLKKTIENMGYYWVHQTPEEFQAHRDDPGKLDELFRRLMLERLQAWMALAGERLAGSPLKLFMSAGNDDHMEVDAVLNSCPAVTNGNDRIVPVNGCEMATFAWANPTPWNTPREKPDEQLEPMLEELISGVADKSNAIFNFHVPPHGYALDLAPELTADLVQAADRKVHVGSRAVARMIEKYQPLLGLHGHIHESRGVQRIGRTVVLNPGSEYSEGILKGVVVVLSKGRVQDYIFTSG